jgi:hypothetical protein
MGLKLNTGDILYFLASSIELPPGAYEINEVFETHIYAVALKTNKLWNISIFYILENNVKIFPKGSTTKLFDLLYRN